MFIRFRGRRPSHGTIVAYLALFSALVTGGAYAADKITSKDIAKKAVKSKHIAKNAVKSKHVKNGQLKVADLADEAQGARAFAVVDVTSSVDPILASDAPERGFDSVERDSTGVYCLTPSPGGVDPADDPAAVTVDWFHTAGDQLAAYLSSPVDDCNVGEYEVHTYDLSGNESDDVGFGVVVP